MRTPRLIQATLSELPTSRFAVVLAVALAACGGGPTGGGASSGGTTNGTAGDTSGGTVTTGGSTPASTGSSSTSSSGSPGSSGGSSPGSTAPAHHRCGWIAAGDAKGVAAFVANASYFDAIHPVWYQLTSDGVSVQPIGGADDPQVIAAASANHVALMPLVAAVQETATLRDMLANHVTAHVQSLVDLAVSKDYAGLEIDYEGLDTPGDRPGFTAFIQALAPAMHAAGKQVSLAVPGLNTSNASANGYDYAALSQSADVVHIMGYDFHWLGGDHLGPVAPKGWVDSVATYAASTGNAAKFVLGVPNYGIGNGWYCQSQDCAAACGGSYATTTDHMKTCPYGSYDAGRSPNCVASQGLVYFDDLASLEEKVQIAQAHGLGGISHYSLGGEPAGFFDMVRKYY